MIRLFDAMEPHGRGEPACGLPNCDLPQGHDNDGWHATVSLSGLVVEAFDVEPMNTDAVALIRKVNAIRDDVIQAAESAEWELRDLRKSAAAKSDPALMELLREAEIEIGHDTSSVGLDDDEAEWPAELDAIRSRLKRTGKVAS